MKLNDKSKLFLEDPFYESKIFYRVENRKVRGRDQTFGKSEFDDWVDPEATGTILDLNYEEIVDNYKKKDSLGDIDEENEDYPPTTPEYTATPVITQRRISSTGSMARRRSIIVGNADPDLRNFNEIDIMGRVARDGNGQPFVFMDEH